MGMYPSQFQELGIRLAIELAAYQTDRLFAELEFALDQDGLFFESCRRMLQLAENF
jgi:hypothetical protein